MQLMEMTGAGRTAIKTLVARKKWEMRKFRTKTSDGKILDSNHYNIGKL
jgi:hypothetical protein